MIHKVSSTDITYFSRAMNHTKGNVPIFQSAGMLGIPASRPLSMATNVSVELGGYQRALEDVLTWLLEAEDRLANAPGTDGPLHQIKEQFHTHEVRFRFSFSPLHGTCMLFCIISIFSSLLAIFIGVSTASE